MAELVFKSPGFFEREIVIPNEKPPEGFVELTPAGIVGATQRGPAFVPVTVTSYKSWENIFGKPTRDNPVGYAVQEYFDAGDPNDTSVTFVRVLGAGANTLNSEIQSTKINGTATNAGFFLQAKSPQVHSAYDPGGETGAVQFLTAVHQMNPHEDEALRYYSDNDTVNTAADFALVRGVIFCASGSRIQLLNHNEEYYPTLYKTFAKVSDNSDNANIDSTFKIVVSSSNVVHGNHLGNNGIRVYTASLNPDSDLYISKVLNTNHRDFGSKQHLLYTHYPVSNGIARVKYDADFGTVGIVSGSSKTSQNSTDETQTFKNAFGRFDARYQTAKSTFFISQPYGKVEHDLFYFESLDDGEAGNDRVKVTISNVKRSTDENYPYGSFNVQIRSFYDSDETAQVLEEFVNCSLDPKSPNYVAKLIGDRKLALNFDSRIEDKKRYIISGKYKSKSKYVRIVMNEAIEKGNIPKNAVPFGYRGLPFLKTYDDLSGFSASTTGEQRVRLTGSVDTTSVSRFPGLLETGSFPPVPFRYKITKGVRTTSPTFSGDTGTNPSEQLESRLCWGMKMSDLAKSGSTSPTNITINENYAESLRFNEYFENVNKFMGIDKFDVLITGSSVDDYNNNKFSLSRVSLGVQASRNSTLTQILASSSLTGDASNIMKKAAYIRNGVPTSDSYTVNDAILNDYVATLGTLMASSDATKYNRFSDYAKFTNVLYGGFDGVNMLDRDMRLLNDRACDDSDRGKANTALYNVNLPSSFNPGLNNKNNHVYAYQTAIDKLTEKSISNISILAIPDIRAASVTDHASKAIRSFQRAIYIMDIPYYDTNTKRIYTGENSYPSVLKTITQFENRSIDNNYVATYFPNVRMKTNDGGIVDSPPSVAALSAYALNDKQKGPWFAPAGFSRGSLNFVQSIQLRLKQSEKDSLYEGRINPIASIPGGGFVIFGQKTLQKAKTSLDRVNVRRLLIHLKRKIASLARSFLFEQNDAQTRVDFRNSITSILVSVQEQQGVDDFRVVCDATNNTLNDKISNRLNCKIVLVPTRAIEYIALDFVITDRDVDFR